MPDYEREVGPDIGEALGGIETHRMSDLEGRWAGFPEGTGDIYRKPRPVDEIIDKVAAFLPVERENLLEDEQSLDDGEDGDFDDEDPMDEGSWQGNGAEPEEGQDWTADVEEDDDLDPGEDPYFEGSWDIENDAD